jgi:AAA ATPase domain
MTDRPCPPPRTVRTTRWCARRSRRQQRSCGGGVARLSPTQLEGHPTRSSKHTLSKLSTKPSAEGAKRSMTGAATDNVRPRVGPVRLTLVMAEASNRARNETLSSLPSRDPVGAVRANERARLLAALDWLRAEVGDGGVLQITGSAGLGKTWLLEQLLQEAQARSILTLFGRATQPESGRPYDIVSDAIEAARAEIDDEVLARLDEETRLALGAIVPLAEHQAPTSPVAGYRLGRAVWLLLQALSAERPVLLVVDDAHWASRDSLTLLHHLLRRPPQGPVLIVLSYRVPGLPVALEAARTCTPSTPTSSPTSTSCSPVPRAAAPPRASRGPTATSASSAPTRRSPTSSRCNAPTRRPKTFAPPWPLPARVHARARHRPRV